MHMQEVAIWGPCGNQIRRLRVQSANYVLSEYGTYQLLLDSIVELRY